MVHHRFIRIVLLSALCYPVAACSSSGSSAGGSNGDEPVIDTAEDETPKEDTGDESDDDLTGLNEEEDMTDPGTDDMPVNPAPDPQVTEEDTTPVIGINEGGTDPLPALPEDEALPIIFVHDLAGSAQQFESQAIRYVANGYPPQRLYAYEHDGTDLTDTSEVVTGMDAVVTELQESFDEEQVYLIAHGRGTSLATTYLSNPQNAVKVAKYIALDGAGCVGINVPCIAPAAEENTQFGQTTHLEGQTHMEVATSPESFAAQYEFLLGELPQVTEIVLQRQPIQIAGRAVYYPDNAGVDGAVVDVWELDASSGSRVGDAPVASFTLGEEGSFGPVTVRPDTYYEHVVYFPDSSTRHHYYPQPYLRSTGFVRLMTGDEASDTTEDETAAESESETATETDVADLGNPSADHAVVTLVRQREWTPADVVEVMTQSESGNETISNIISEEIGTDALAITIEDDVTTPGESSLVPLAWFDDQPFQTGIDGYIPASVEPNGTITITNMPRGDLTMPQVVNLPNWASSEHTITVLFSDYPH